MGVAASKEMELYFQQINKEVDLVFSLAKSAREKGLDPEMEVSIPIAKNMAERVVGLVSIAAPQIINTGILARIASLEETLGLLDWRVGFRIAEEIAQEKFCKFKDQTEAMEVGIRVGFAYLTLGIVSAPLEGFIGLKIKKRRDGKNYLALKYAGPIRGAGGTAAAVSVILSDYVRIKMGFSEYDPSEMEINRYAVEIQDYHERVTNLQYRPSEEELKFLVSKLPVEVDGDPTERIEVSNYKDLPRIETNFIRGGVALVLAEGISQKSAKIWKRLSKWGKEFGLSWDWLEEFIAIKERVHSAGTKQKSEEGGSKLKANNTFIMDLVAGRPIITHPLAVGGLRLRYGRTRTSGFSSAAIHPATLQVLEKFIAIGTQLKVERPGKAATITACDSLEGPIVRLTDGSVIKLNNEEEAKSHLAEIEEIIFLGDILFNYGDFSENGHILVPAGYCPEWWSLELEKSIFSSFTPEKLGEAADFLGLNEEKLRNLLENPIQVIPSFEEALSLSKSLNIPLHPEYTFYWKLISGEDLIKVKDYLQQGRVKKEGSNITKIILPFHKENSQFCEAKKILDFLGVPHKIVRKENLVIEKKEANILAFSFNFQDQETLEKLAFALELVSGKNGLDFLNSINSIKIKDKAGTFIGARMGRPEKAKMRHMTGSPQVMFPVGEEGDRLRSFQSSIKAGKIRSAFPLFFCEQCQIQMIYPHCEECGKKCIKKFNCRFCGDLEKGICRHGPASPYKIMDLPITYYFNKAKERLKEVVHPDLIKGVRGTSNKEHIVEHLCKGILRAKHDIYVNKDGTTRYDCTELPITHFKPKEIGTSVAKLVELGYLKDIKGRDLVDIEQILELKPQDIILPGFDSLEESASSVLSRVAKYVDDLLVNFYKLRPFYNYSQKEDLVGHLVIGLAPHISAGMVGRIIGFSEVQALLAHPMYHAGMRRDCDGDEAAVMLLMDALLNFSRQFLPSSRGSTMDSPLVLTILLNPAEVDDMVHGLDVMWRYPLELYEAALEMKAPWEVKYGVEKKKIEQLRDRLGTELQYEKIGFTHNVENFNKGVLCSAYKTLPSMEEKLIGQMEIAKKVRAVNMDDVAKLVIQKHFLKDIKGNLKKFGQQQFRCVKCNEKYHRPPLNSCCAKCKGRLIFTISEGSVTKYLGHSLTLSEKYDFSPYLKQTIEMLKVNVDHFFGKEKEKQVGLAGFLS